MKNWTSFFAGLGAVLSCSIAIAADFTYDDLTKLIREKHLDSIEKTLPELPAELRSNYTLMKKSRSTQAADRMHPRAILFGLNGRLTCTFGSGEPGFFGGDTMECIQFIAAESRFDFRQIQFPNEENGLKEVAFSEPNLAADGRVTCLGCHGGRDPRPNWDSYSRWPGAYGEQDDSLDASEAYSDFVAKRDSHPRYKWLIQSSDANAPYARIGQIQSRPNLRFSEFVGRMNGWRAERLLAAATEHWETLAFGMNALECELTGEQKDLIARAGIHEATISTLALAAFAKVGLRNNQWSPAIFADATAPGVAHNHQAGYSYLAESVGMATVTKLARAGNAPLSAALASIEEYYARNYADQPADLAFRQQANAILFDPDHFSGGRRPNINLICPEIARLFTQEYIAAEGVATPVPTETP